MLIDDRRFELLKRQVDRISEIRSTQYCACQTCVAKIGMAKIRVAEVRSGEISIPKTRVAQVGSPEKGAVQVNNRVRFY